MGYYQKIKVTIIIGQELHHFNGEGSLGPFKKKLEPVYKLLLICKYI